MRSCCLHGVSQCLPCRYLALRQPFVTTHEAQGRTLQGMTRDSNLAQVRSSAIRCKLKVMWLILCSSVCRRCPASVSAQPSQAAVALQLVRALSSAYTPGLLELLPPVGATCEPCCATRQAAGHGRLVDFAPHRPWPLRCQAKRHQQPQLAPCRSALPGVSGVRLIR